MNMNEMGTGNRKAVLCTTDDIVVHELVEHAVLLELVHRPTPSVICMLHVASRHLRLLKSLQGKLLLLWKFGAGYRL